MASTSPLINSLTSLLLRFWDTGSIASCVTALGAGMENPTMEEIGRVLRDGPAVDVEAEEEVEVEG